jgi:UDP-glucose:(heptosyl)LPS alpha-1,3-glucosyltransferase
MAGPGNTNGGGDMNLAFVLYKYFPYGGLQRDMVRIAEVCQRQGHEIHVFTLNWEGHEPPDFHIHVLQFIRRTNHAKYQVFCRSLPGQFGKYGIDRVVGFNKMPGLDFYYAADPCLKEKLMTERSWITRQLPRYRHFLEYEKEVFNSSSRTEILMISQRQKAIYQHYYATPDKRMHMLPPGIGRDRMATPDAARIRAEFRAEFGLAEEDLLILCIGSGFKTKGLDRSLKALASLPPTLAVRTRLIALGSDNAASFVRLAKTLGVIDRFQVFYGRDDIPRFLQGGDLLLHPAYYENSGIVILEAVVAGLPVLVTDNCGYAFYVEEAVTGNVVAAPFSQENLNQLLAQMLTSPDRSKWSSNGIAYGQTHDLYSMAKSASQLILART